MQREPTYRHTYRAALRAKCGLHALPSRGVRGSAPAPAVVGASLKQASLLRDAGSAEVRSLSGPVPSPQPRASALSISTSGEPR